VRASREGNTIGLYIKAIELLASDDAWARQGGVYALEHLCGLDTGYRGQVHALLTAFVRSHAPWPPIRPEAEVDAERAVTVPAGWKRDSRSARLSRVDKETAEINGSRHGSN
jgi:hypothetical protein